MGSSDQNPGTTLAQSLLGQTEREASMTPMDAVLDAARQEHLTADQCFRLGSLLGTLKRLMYYVYGGGGRQNHFSTAHPPRGSVCHEHDLHLSPPLRQYVLRNAA